MMGAILLLTPKIYTLNSFFASVFTQEDTTTLPHFSGETFLPDIAPIHINIEGVEQLLLGLKSHKAPGPDMIPANLLIKLAHQLAPVLTLLFQVSLDQGQLPEDWKIANVIPVYKKGSRSCSSNYRPISLTSIYCKVMEHIVYSNVLQHFRNTMFCTRSNMASRVADHVKPNC